MSESRPEAIVARTRFRFKSRRSSVDSKDKDRNAHKVRHRDHSHPQDSHSTETDASQRPKRRKFKNDDHEKPREALDEHCPERPFSDPEAAFREALFDAMADDEGAAYWANVYEQPLHIYSNTKPGPNGELERMNDDEYTAFVRAKMYEKTHEHLIAERNRREDIRMKEREQRQRKERFENEQRSFQVQMEESLRRGERRRAQKQWGEAWDRYVKGWERLLSGGSHTERDGETMARDVIPWPVKSARLSDVNREDIESFFRNAPCILDAAEPSWQRLKLERIRWHPDKMQQRFEGGRLDNKSIRAVTAVFQVIDRMYNESRVNAAQTLDNDD